MKKYFKNLCRVLLEPSLLCNRFWRSDVIDPILTFFNPRQKWLTKVIPNTWCDKVELVPTVNFAILVDFVESEKGLSQLDLNWSDDLKNGYVSQEYIDNVNRVYGELKDVYTYIKVERPHLEKQLSESYPPFPDSKDVPYSVAYSEVNRIEKCLADKDTWALLKIIEHRGCLWT